MMPQFNRSLTTRGAFALSLLLTCTFVIAPANAQSPMLNGRVQEDTKYKNEPSLSRSQIKDKGDPFGNGGPAATETFDAPDNMFQGQVKEDDIPKPPFNLNAQDSGMDSEQPMNGMQGTPAPPPQPPANLGNQGTLQPPPQFANVGDPDQSAQMQVAWDLWHRQVAENIFMRFDPLAQKAFGHSRPLGCQVVYTVTRDHQIGNVRMLQKSPNIVFNTMVMMVLKSMNGNPLLEFPPGSRRMSVEKMGTFSCNFGMQGFKHTTGDQEQYKIPGQRGGMHPMQGMPQGGMQGMPMMNGMQGMPMMNGMQGMMQGMPLQ